MAKNTNLSKIESKKQTNKKNRGRFMDTENILMVSRCEGVWGNGLKGKRIKKYKYVVTE